jgi:hypothetical protein
MQAIDSGGGLETHCAMCAASVTIGRKVMGRNDYGKLIYAPELSQKNVSDIVRITIATNLLPPDSIPKVIRQNSKTLFDGLMSEQYLLDGDVFPFFEGSYGNLEDLADICRYATPKVKDKYASLFKDIRFLPDIEAFKGPVQFWLKANPQFFQPLTQQQKAV